MVSQNHLFVTLTFATKWHQHGFKWLFNNTIIPVLKYLNKVGAYELAYELTEKGVLHYHIIIKVKDMIKFKVFTNYWSKHHGFVDIKPVKNYLGAFIYIRKDSNDMSQLMFKDPNYKQIITNSTSATVFKYYLDKCKENAKQVKKANKIQGALDQFFKL